MQRMQNEGEGVERTVCKILVTGSREYENYDKIRAKLDEIYCTFFYGEVPILIQGGAPGADTLAKLAVRSYVDPWEIITEKAKWTEHVKPWCWCQAPTGVCKGAGPRRNSKMLTYEPDICVSFGMGKTGGTLDMVVQAQEADIMTIGFN